MQNPRGTSQHTTANFSAAFSASAFRKLQLILRRCGSGVAGEAHNGVGAAVAICGERNSGVRSAEWSGVEWSGDQGIVQRFCRRQKSSRV